MISADSAMYASKRAGKNRVTGVPASRSAGPSRRRRCSIRPCRSSDPEPTAARTRPSDAARLLDPGDPGASPRSRGSTRRRPASRSTRPRRSPRDDAEELGAVLDRRAAGLRLQPDRQPDDDRARRGRRRARGRRGRASPSRRGWPRSTPRSRRWSRAGDRIVAPTRLYGSTRALLAGRPSAARRPDRLRRHHRPRRRRARRSRRRRPASSTPRRSPTRRPSSPTMRRSPSSPTATARRTSSTTRSPRRTSAGRSSSGRTSSSSRRRSSSAGHSDVHRRRRRRRGARSPSVERVQIDTGATLGPLEAFLVAARDPDAGGPDGAPRGDGGGTRGLARASGRRVAASSTRGSPSHPQHDVARPPVPAGVGGGMLAFEVGRRPGRRAGVHRRPDAPGADRVARQRPHDGRPPAVDDRTASSTRRRSPSAGITAGPAARARSGSRTSTTSSADFERGARGRAGRRAAADRRPTRPSAPV